MPDRPVAEGPAREGHGSELRDHLASHVAALAAALPYVAEVEPVHDIRVRARRLRSLLTSHSSFLPHTTADALSPRELLAELRWLGRTVGQLRDLDVLSEQLALVDADAAVRDRWLMVLHEQRVAALSRVEEGLSGPRAARLLAELGWLVAADGWSEALPATAGDVLPARRLRVLEHADRAMALGARRSARRMRPKEVAAWHDVRKAAKELRYAAEAFTTHDPSATRWASAGRRLQVVLGSQLDGDAVASWLAGFAADHAGEPDLAAASKAHARTERQLVGHRSEQARRVAVTGVQALQ